ncbi:fasciclin domain-containing protein [Sphingobium boeckii]|uniref:Putative surface protein with fasciclin (FAS1) repeats n=1 Tax=Sphingobium boeckii TaxID=1082345 RepID=A0A7W9EEZ5_9SPHN|nr:putative surface protein with fasciclin (FAS1) repeats [Sphingobium boeckii]
MTSSSLMICAGTANAMQAQAAPAAPAEAAANPVVGGAEMLPTKTIVENASASKDHTTLVAAITAAGLVEALSGPGPFTVFAPTNDAFTAFGADTVATLMKPESKPNLEKVLKYHVVAGKITREELLAKLKAGGGKTTLTTLEGSPISVSLEAGDNILLTDVIGNAAYITQADVNQSNGVIHVVNGVLAPKLG